MDIPAKQRIKAAMIRAAAHLGAPTRHAGLLIVLFHDVVSDREPQPRWTVRAGELDAMIRHGCDHGVRWLTAGEADGAIRAGSAEGSICLTFDDGKQSAHPAILSALARGARCSQFIITERVGTAGFMSWSQIRELSDAGVEIGSHTRSHPELPALPRRALDGELAGSRAEIEDRLGREVRSFAYPYGLFDRATIEAVRSAGYRQAFTTQHVYADARFGPLGLPRLEPESLRELSDLHRGSAALFYRALAAFKLASTPVRWPSAGGFGVQP